MSPIAARTSPDKQLERAKVEGWGYTGDMATEVEVLELLHSLVRVTKPDLCVETGTYTGFGTQAIASALEKNEKGRLITIEFEENTYPALPRTTFIKGDSVQWSKEHCPEDVDWAFVDCGTPEIRVQAFRNIFVNMADNGLILVHDTWFHEDGFRDALADAAGRDPDFEFSALNGIAAWQT